MSVLSKERLTERHKNGIAMVKGCGGNCKYGFSYCRKDEWENCKTISDLIDKLAEYEELEEQGLILRLPVAVGQKVYEIIEETVPKHYYYISEYEVQNISAKAVMYANDWCELDYPNLYFDREIAEEKLRELEGK